MIRGLIEMQILLAMFWINVLLFLAIYFPGHFSIMFN